MNYLVYAIVEVERVEIAVEIAVERYQRRTGKKPTRALVSSKAKADLLQALEKCGLSYKVMTGILPHDVWLEKEEKQEEAL